MTLRKGTVVPSLFHAASSRIKQASGFTACTLTTRLHSSLLVCMAGVFVCAPFLFAAEPPALPGEEITTDMSATIKHDSASRRTPISSPLAPEWYTDAVKSWDAPPLTQQLDEDETPIPFGKGAVFIPRLSDPSLEPDIQIADSTGKIIASGKPGRKFGLVPGTYSVMIGSGSTRQRITKWVTIDEGKITPLYPTWCGLAIEVVNETNIPFKGSYEMARIDEFEPFGRTYGRDPTLGERVKTWILKPGLYKIFGVGESYNTVNSYVTVRLLPGELIHFTIVQDPNTQKITSGGVSRSDDAAKKLSSHWRYGLDLGGSILFNTSNDTNNSAIVFLTNLRVNHTRNKGDWDTKFFFDEELNFANFNISEINSTSDDFQVYSLYVWRLLPWVGPYGRMQFQTHFFPVYDRFDQASSRHLYVLTAPDSTVEGLDSSHTTHRLEPSLSPMTIELGIGTNLDAITTNNFDGKFKLGFGYSQRAAWSQYQNTTKDSLGIKTRETSPSAIIDSSGLDSILSSFIGNVKILERQKDNTVLSYGPEASVDANIRLGRWGTAEGELIVRLPVVPLLKEHSVRPDYKVNTIISWRITNSITLDYLYQYQYSQPLKTDVKVDLSQHRVWLRYAFNTSR